MATSEIFAERLRELRNDNGVSLKDLANSLDTTAQSLSLYERAERTINIDLLYKIAKYFNVSADYLLGLTDNKTFDITVKAICEYTGLNDEAVESLANFARLDFSEPGINETPEESEMNLKISLNIFKIRNDFIASDWFWDIMDHISELDIISEQWKNAVTNQVLAELKGNNEYRFFAETMNISKECDVIRYLITEKINEYINFYDKRIDDEHKRILSNFEREQKLKEKILREASENGEHNPPKE